MTTKNGKSKVEERRQREDSGLAIHLLESKMLNSKEL